MEPDAQRDRPAMDPGYGIHAGEEGLLPWSFVADRMAGSRNYWVVTTRSDGRPHAMPVWGVWFEDALRFSTSPRSVKGRNLAADPRVVVHLESGDECVVVDGTVEAMTGPDSGWFDRLADAYEAKYEHRPGPPSDSGAWFTLRPATVLAWREADYPSSATRWRLPG